MSEVTLYGKSKGNNKTNTINKGNRDTIISMHSMRLTQIKLSKEEYKRYHGAGRSFHALDATTK